MARSTARTAIGAATALLLFTLTACGGGESTAPGAKVAASPGAAAAATRPAAATTSATKAEVALGAAGGSSVTGKATLEQAAERAAYRVDVSEVTPGPHAMYIFEAATCGTGNRMGPLSVLEASADGRGSVEGSMIQQLGTLVGRSLAVYAGDKGDSGIVACGRITAAP